MKTIIFKGGLGNQLFQYCLYCKLKEKGFHVKGLNGCSDHNGYELEKYFDVKVDFCHPLYVYIFILICKLPSRLRNMFIIERFFYTENWKAIFYNDYWQSKKYFPKERCVYFKDLQLNEQNQKILNRINTTHSVSIHIRRGDYLQNTNLFTNLSETDYYSESIRLICEKIGNPQFFIFSNDSDWCKKNITPPNAIYIDWNTGQDSIYDMFLMSKCKINIIANSTFSFCAAYLNEKAKLVVYPRKWYNGFKDETLDIFPDEWLAI